MQFTNKYRWYVSMVIGQVEGWYLSNSLGCVKCCCMKKSTLAQFSPKGGNKLEYFLLSFCTHFIFFCNCLISSIASIARYIGMV